MISLHMLTFRLMVTMVAEFCPLVILIGNEQNPYIWFSMGIDHSNPYIHSTTVLCDMCLRLKIPLPVDMRSEVIISRVTSFETSSTQNTGGMITE